MVGNQLGNEQFIIYTRDYFLLSLFAVDQIIRISKKNSVK